MSTPLAQTNLSRNLSPYSAERTLGSIDQANARESNLDTKLVLTEKIRLAQSRVYFPSGNSGVFEIWIWNLFRWFLTLNLLIKNKKNKNKIHTTTTNKNKHQSNIFISYWQFIFSRLSPELPIFDRKLNRESFRSLRLHKF